MSSVQIEQKRYEMPFRAKASRSRISSPSPTSTDQLIFMKKVFGGPHRF